MINRMDRDKELRLVRKANNNDASAFDELLNAHMPIIHMLACRLQTTTDLHEELTQAGRIGFMQALRRYNSEKHVRLITYAVPWITGEMKRALRSYESNRMRFIPYESLDSYIEDSMHDSSNLDSFPIDLDIKAAFDRLNEEERKLLMLRYFRGQTQKETALILKKSQAQISKAERRILDELRCQLE